MSDIPYALPLTEVASDGTPILIAEAQVAGLVVDIAAARNQAITVPIALTVA